MTEIWTTIQVYIHVQYVHLQWTCKCMLYANTSNWMYEKQIYTIHATHFFIYRFHVIAMLPPPLPISFLTTKNRILFINYCKYCQRGTPYCTILTWIRSCNTFIFGKYLFSLVTCSTPQHWVHVFFSFCKGSLFTVNTIYWYPELPSSLAPINQMQATQLIARGKHPS